jgi:hypothetical protein
VCLKCGENHSIKDYKSNDTKFANFDGDHKTNSQEREIYSLKLNDEIKSKNKIK